MNSFDNVDDQEDYGFRGSYFKILPKFIDDYTRKKCLNMQLENLILQINIDNTDKKNDERYKINMVYDKDSDVTNQIGKKYEEKMTSDIELLKLQQLS